MSQLLDPFAVVLIQLESAGTPGAPSKASPAAGAKVPDTTPYDVAKTIDSSIVDSIEVDLGDF